MSNCGSCRKNICTCQFVGDSTSAKVLGVGNFNEPFQVRPITPNYRPVGEAHRTTSQSITGNVDTPIAFQDTYLSNMPAVNMWVFTQPTKLTAPIAGLYMVGGMAVQDDSELWSVWIVKNGFSSSPLVRRTAAVTTFSPFMMVDVMTLVRLAAGDYIELYVRGTNTGGTNNNLGPSTPGVDISVHPWLWAQWMDD